MLVDRCIDHTVSDVLETKKTPLTKFSKVMKEMEAVDDRCSYYEEILDQLTSLVQEEDSLKSKCWSVDCCSLYWLSGHP